MFDVELAGLGSRKGAVRQLHHVEGAVPSGILNADGVADLGFEGSRATKVLAANPLDAPKVGATGEIKLLTEGVPQAFLLPGQKEREKGAHLRAAKQSADWFVLKCDAEWGHRALAALEAGCLKDG